MDKEDLKYIDAGVLGCSESELTEDLSQEVDSEGNPLTKEQVEFFKNSKVRDKQGRLLVCYHGTDAEFNVFERGDIGFHFGTKEQANNRLNAKNVSNKIIKKYYLNIKNPYVLDTDITSYGAFTFMWFYCISVPFGTSFDDEDELLRNLLVSKEEFDYIRKNVPFDDSDVNNAIRDSELTYNSKENVWVRNYLKSKGYDGVVYLNEIESFREKSYIAFYPNQIKSITNTNPSNRNDINEELLYHGQDDDDMWDRENTLTWYTTSEKYAKQYGKKIFTKDIDLSKYNLLDLGEINDEVFDNDGKYTKEFKQFCNKIEMTPKQLEKYLKQFGWYPEHLNFIFDITCEYPFYKLLIDLGYDGVKAKEGGYDTYGLIKSELTEDLDSKKLGAHLMNYIDKRKGNKIKESVDNKNFTFPDLRRAIDFFWQDRDAKIETVPIKKLVDDNNLLNDDDLQSYHQRQWNNKKASEFSIDKSKVNSMRISEVPYAVRKKDGKLELGDGRHRTRALYNDGYEYVTLPVINESKTTPRIRESLLQEGKQDKENFRKWAEQAVEIAYKDRGLSDWERKGNAEYIVNWFENNRKNLNSPQNDYYYWIKEKNVQGAYDELNRLAVEQEKKKDSEKKSKDGARLIYSDSNWKVYEITTYEASVKYGANTKWCISGSKRWSNGANGRGYWDDYTSKGVKFYFFIGKDTKYAIAIYPNGTDFEIFDAQDNSIAYIPNAPIIDEIKVDYYSHNEDRLMLNLIKTGQLPHVCSLLSTYLWESGYSINIYDKSKFDNFLQQIEEGVNEDYVKWLAVYNGLKDEEWYEEETGEKYEDEWYYGDTTRYLQNDLGFLDNYATLEDALTKDNPYFNYDNNEYFISDLYDEDIDCCKDWVAVWLYLRRYLEDETDLLNSIKDEISTNWGYSDFEKVGLSKEYLQGEKNIGESLDDFEDEVGKVYHGGIEKSLHKDFKSILWFTEDYDYALDFGENIFICNLNLKNTLIVGNTDGYIRGLIPTQFSTDFTRLANNLRVTPKELLKCNPEASKIYSIVRTKAFKDLCIKNGYDSVETEEFGHVCFGVFNLDQVDIVDTDFEDESALETLSPMDESLKPRVREELLLEKGTDYKKQAVKIISNSGLFDEETSTKIIDGLFRQDIHAFNHAPAWLEKYLKGIARMLVQYCDGDKSKAQQFLTECPSEFEYYLTWVKQNREKIGNSLDDEFVNNLTYEQVKEKNNKIRDEIDAKSKDELSKMKVSNSSNYTLVPIDSYEQMHKLYGGHWTGDGTDEEGEYAGNDGTSWCHTNSKNTYANWTKGDHRFFVLQHNNWKDIPFNEKTNKEMSGKDDYGNSLIAILVNKYGKLNNVTLRCNHVGVSGSSDNQYNSYSELSKVAGFNVEEEVLKYDFEEFSTDKLFTIYDGSLIRASNNTEIYIDIVEYKIPIGVKNISFSTFENCIHLTSIEIPSSVTEIGDYAFANCRSLRSIKIPASVTSIGNSVFENCSNLESIEIPDSVTSIGEYAFCDCSNLRSIEVPAGVESIGYSAFESCSNLRSITFQEGSKLTSIGKYAFKNCSSLTSIKIPASVTSIGNYAFYYCINLRSIEIPASVTSIGAYTFSGCRNLRSIKIPNSVTSIGSSTFRGCSSLTSITIPEGVTSIGAYTFYGCRNLTSIEIPTSVTSIGYSNFDDCSPNLTVFTDNEYVIRYCNKDNIKCAPLSE